MADLFVIVAIGLAFIWLRPLIMGMIEQRREFRHRRATLRYDEDAKLYRWTTLNGTEQTSETHPDRPGGAWYEDTREGLESMRP